LAVGTALRLMTRLRNGERMTNLQIEAWARQRIEQAMSNAQDEDSRVEFKAEWPSDHARAAGQLAALCNAARGEPVMWIIGVHPEQGVVGAAREDLANWWPAVEKWFDSVAPSLRDLTFGVGDRTVVVLHFETDRAPFVVANPAGGIVSHWVPWREGTRTRAAKRGELLRMLMPAQLLPDVEVLSRRLKIDNVNGPWIWDCIFYLYITPLSSQRIVIVGHRCSASFDAAGIKASAEGPGMRSLSPTISATTSEAIINGPGQLEVRYRFPGPKPPAQQGKASLQLRLAIAGVDRIALIEDEAAPVSLAEWGDFRA
jgi:hypothetical protein